MEGYPLSDTCEDERSATCEVSVSNNFSINTGFSDYVTLKNGVVGANWTLNLRMGGTRTWSFTIANNL